MAFCGMNPEVEKMMADERLRKEEVVKTEQDVGDEEMAAHYGALHGTVGRKFATKRAIAATETASVSSQKSGEELLQQGAQIMDRVRGDKFHCSSSNKSPANKKKKFMKPAE